MYKSEAQFEAFKEHALDVDTIEVESVIHAIREALAVKDEAAIQMAKTVNKTHSHDHERVWHLYQFYNALEPRFGEVVCPVELDDVLRFFDQLGTNADTALSLWEELVYPERDKRDGESQMDRLRATPFEDIYPVHLLAYNRPKVHEYGGLEPDIDPYTAVVDAVSLKTYLAWLDDREPHYETMLIQHMPVDVRALWQAFVQHLEQLIGQTFPVHHSGFRYFDNAAEYLCHRESSRRIAIDQYTAYKDHLRPRLTHSEVYRLNLQVPNKVLEIARGVKFIPEDGSTENAENHIGVKNFYEIGKELGMKGYFPATVFNRVVYRIAALDPDCFGAGNYLAKVFGPALYGPRDQMWHNSSLYIDAGVLREWFHDVPRKGHGKLGPKERLLVAGLLGQFKIDEYLLSTIKVADPADEAEINLDDPDLD